VHGVLTGACPNGTLESVAGDGITHWRQRQTRGRRFVVAFACVVEALPMPLGKHWVALHGRDLGGVTRAGSGAAAYENLGFAMVVDTATRFVSFLNTSTAYSRRQRWRPQNPYTVISMSEICMTGT
jgi:hypothetical protein